MTINKKKILFAILAGGQSKRFGGGFKTFAKIKNNSSILIIGPSGIGKNFLANTIHMRLSSNNPDTFINLNENLLNETDLLKLSSLHNYFTIYLNDYENFNQIEEWKYFSSI